MKKSSLTSVLGKRPQLIPNHCLKNILVIFTTLFGCVFVTYISEDGDRMLNIGRNAGIKNSVSKITYSLVEDANGIKRYAASQGIGDSNSSGPLSIVRWAELFLSDDGSNAKALTSLLQSIPFEAFYFETKGVSGISASQEQFEFVVVDAPSLFQFCHNKPDPNAFTEHFSSDCSSSKRICTFPNLGGDAILVVPKPEPKVSNNVYSHLAEFLRDAPFNQVERLWKEVARNYLRKLTNDSESTIWLSTSGSGISWLHFRLDTVPKYYTYKPFTEKK